MLCVWFRLQASNLFYLFFWRGGGRCGVQQVGSTATFFFFILYRSVFSQYMSLFMQYARTLSTTTSKLSFCSKLASKLRKFRSCNYSLYNVNYRLLQNLFFSFKVQSITSHILLQPLTQASSDPPHPPPANLIISRTPLPPWTKVAESALVLVIYIYRPLKTRSFKKCKLQCTYFIYVRLTCTCSNVNP